MTQGSIPQVFAEIADTYTGSAAQCYFSKGIWHRSSYGELLRQARQVSAALKAAGLKRGQSVVLPSVRTNHLCAHLLGILWAGGHYVFVDPEYPAERRAFVIRECAAEFGLLDDEQELPSEVLNWLRVDWKEQQPDEEAPVCDADLPAYVVFTSGSTGVPKGVVIPHRGVVRLVRDTTYIDFSPTNVFLQLSALSFDASTLELWGALLNGGTCVLHPENGATTAASIQSSIESQRVTTLWLTSSLYNAIISEHPESLREIRQLLVGGEALSVAHIRRGLTLLPSTRIFNGYGPTENTTFTTVYPIPSQLPADVKRIPIGYPIAGTQCELFDEKLEPELDPSKPAELITFGEGLALGYLQRPELTAQKFIDIRCADGVTRRGYRTGDLVLRNTDGSFDYISRNDKQVKIDGHRIEPGEIELYLNQLPAITEARVVLRVGPEGQKRLAAYYVPTQTLDRSSLRRQLSQHFPAYMVPHFLIAMKELPKNQNGKLDESRLPDPFVEARNTAPDRAAIAECWREVLGRAVEPTENFLDAGGTSLEALRLAEKISSRMGVDLPITFVFEFPTIDSQNRHFAQKDHVSTTSLGTESRAEFAIVGMAARLPGAKTAREYWQNLLEGKETVTFLEPDELDPEIDPQESTQANYVRAKGLVEDCDKFDAEFFGVSPIEANLMDPQHRVLLELAWHALEDAGIIPGDDTYRTGVFVGANWARYYQKNILPNAAAFASFGGFNTALANETDFLCTRVSYKLNLKGPSVNVYTACSTGLVAVAQACAAIENGDCEQAIAGGVSLNVPLRSGYLYQEASMLSADGHCRPFDINANGTTFNDGASLVVIKRLDLAERDGDRIYAIIRGFAVNNDGEEKASFTAPSVGGQVAVYRQALAKANVAANSIGFIETHGTATPLGDPIEVQALRQVFGSSDNTEKRCALGSGKSNMGHVIHAAGTAGLIKAVLAVRHNQIPATLFFTKPNPKLDLGSTPFFVNNTCITWPIPGVRRAGVTSLGVGGTNAHVIVEEYSKSIPPLSADTARAFPLLISAKTAAGLERQVASYRQYLSEGSLPRIADMAFTSVMSRRAMPFRCAVSGSSPSMWLEQLQKFDAQLATKSRSIAQPKVGFLFSGQGAQRVGMGRHLYDNEPTYRRIFDAGLKLLKEEFALDLGAIVFAADSEEANVSVQQTAIAQPALFLMEYGIAQLLIERGVRPDFLIGHSIGEFAAACVAGVFEFEEALRLVANRGRLMQAMPAGSMLVVKAPLADVEAFVQGPISLAALNAPRLVVLSGPAPDIQKLQETLKSRKIDASLLRTSHAFHSAMMQAAADEFAKAFPSLQGRSARIRIFSTKTGRPITDAELSSAEYWASQLRQPVLFSSAMMAAVEAYNAENLAMIEVGPGSTLCMLASAHDQLTASVKVASQPSSGITDQASRELADCFGALWSAGFPVNWSEHFAGVGARKVHLPGYAFARKRHWVDRTLQTAKNTSPQTAAAWQPPEIETLEEVPMSPAEHLAQIQLQLKSLLEEVTGYDLADVDPEAQFSEIGLDSLLLTQAATEIARKFHVGLTFRHLVEEYTTFGDLAEFVASKVPVATQTVTVRQAAPAADVAVMPNTPYPTAPVTPLNPNTPVVGGNTLQDLMTTQLQIMMQLAAMTSASLMSAAARGVGVASPQPQPQPTAPVAAAQTPAKPATPVQTEAEAPAKPRHTPGTRITREASGAKLTSAQKQWVDDFLNRYQQRFAQSKALTQRYRKCLADPRTVSGFNPEWKEVVFPIVVKGSRGSKLWDIDGNELIDTSNGFGPIFFGHSPEFVTKAVKEQLEIGIETGPQSPLAGEVAELFCELTGNERCCFANTGSEAVIGAVRLARTVTGRPKVVMFEGDYHGIFDEVVVRPGRDHQALPAAPGINRESTANMLILPWGDPESINTIRKIGSDLAAVLCEPVQSRRPEFHSPEYLQELRKVTQEIGAALILDEVVTGFRVHPGGIRKRFNVDADLTSYGKVVGGGYPIGIIGGKAKFMDALDGGQWQFGDASIPEVGVTFFAGTFVRHPVALAAAKAVLLKLKEAGPALYDEMEKKTAAMAAEAKRFIAEMKTEVKFEEFASLYYVSVPHSAHWGHLLFLMMTYEGIHMQQFRPNFMTTEHSAADIDKILKAFKASLAQLIVQGIIDGDAIAAKKYLSGNGGIPAGARLGKNAQGEPAFFIEDPNNKGKYIEVGRP